MNHNPPLLTPDELQFATDTEILRAMYQFQVASVLLAYALVIVFCAVKFLTWVLPKYWYLKRN